MKKTLSIGSGKLEKKENLIRLDISDETGADVIWDLNNTPYPFEDNTFEVIECFDVIEHVNNIPLVMEQCHRILVPNGVMIMTTPHFSAANSYTDPTHKYHLGIHSFDCFSHTHVYSYYSKARYNIKTKKIIFEGKLKKLFFEKLANRFPHFYEKHVCWIIPAWFMYFEIEAIKK